jgi:hypothetical protein
VQLHNDHSISMIPLFRRHDKNSVRYRWKVPEQKIGEFLLWAKPSANSNNILIPPQKQTEHLAILTNNHSMWYQELQDLLHHYILVVRPFVISLWSLEATRVTVSDVFAAWLAIGAYIQDLQDNHLGDNSHGLPEKLIKQVIAIYNFRVQLIFANNLYFVGFCLDPSLWFLFTSDY